MSDIYSVLASSYTSAALTSPSKTHYTNVDPTLYKGSWSGTYTNNQKFSIQISDVQGFRAKVRLQSGGTQSYQDVLIKDNSFRIGDSKFTLTGKGTARVKTAVTDAATGNVSLITGTAKLG